jgi:hypothetical protein
VRARAVILACLALAACGGAVASAAGVGAKVSLTPASGGPSTVFTARFVSAVTTGTFASQRRWQTLELDRSAPAPAGSSCVSSATLELANVAAGSRERVVLDPRELGGTGRWCAGAYDGVIRAFEAPVCAPGTACPAYIVLLGVVGRVRFTVR